MNDMDPHIIELLVLRATEGLNDEQVRQLERLFQDHGLEDTIGLDLAAAAAGNACALRDAADPDDAPEYLKDRLREDAETFFQDDKVVRLKPRSALRERNSANWGWATAAMIAIALIVTNTMDFTSEVTLEEQRNELVVYESTTIIEWGKPENPLYANVTGDVVWNDDLQQGYMLLSNMPVNDPATWQYQLWVIDPDRDANPVDGGVFDIPAGESTFIIPITAKLAVNKPEAFAITREKSGGVVVSKGPLLVVAAG